VGKHGVEGLVSGGTVIAGHQGSEGTIVEDGASSGFPQLQLDHDVDTLSGLIILYNQVGTVSRIITTSYQKVSG
jgi:hypothetical protein